MQPPVPPAFLRRMADLLGDEYPAFAAAYGAPQFTGLRANTLKIEPKTLAGQLPFALEPVPWSDEAFLVSDEARPGKHPYHSAGLYYLQDPSALAPVIALDPQPGECVLDLSAAPGGKSTHIAARLQGEGVLVANEIVNKRAWELAGNLERWGATNVAITNESPERLSERLPEHFDAVLLDAPCSGEGMFHKSAAARQAWSEALLQGCALRQSGILDAAARLVRPGGRLVYSTCTFAVEEDEGAVRAFLQRHPEFEIASIRVHPGFSPGRPDWLEGVGGGSEGTQADLERTVRLWPHQGPGGGHFVALLIRDGAERAPRATPPNPNRAARPVQPYLTWCRDTLADLPDSGLLRTDGGYLYEVPAGLPDLSGLRTIHPGRWLGALKAGRFEPSHALALSLTPADALRTVSLTAGSRAVRAYLHGEVLDDQPGDDGHVLVAVDGFALGWGRRVGGRVKNLYPKGLRSTQI